jgi:hypothetical protein
MNSKGFRWMAQIGVLVLAVSLSALAQNPQPVHFRGTINDFTPASVGGPWEMSGTWSLDLNGDSGEANFSAALTMVRSDLGVTDLNSAKQRSAHTHHLTVVGGTVTPIANGFEVTVPITITANGNFPPPFGTPSTATIDITGGNTVALSNIKVTLAGAAATHFGSQPINGVVRSAE